MGYLDFPQGDIRKSRMTGTWDEDPSASRLSRSYGDPASGVQIPTYEEPQGGGERIGRDVLSDVNAVLRPGSASAGSYLSGLGQPNAPPAASVLTSRSMRTGEDRSAGANDNPNYFAVPPRAAPTGPLTAATENVPYNQNTAALAYAYGGAGDARAAQAEQETYNRNLAGNRAAQASFDLANAQQAARVDRFRATNGADVVLAPENRGYDEQRAQIGKAADQSDARVTGLKADLGLAQGAAEGKRDYINEFVKQQEELNRAQLAGAHGALTGVELEGKKLAIEQQKRVSQVSDALMKAKTPEEASKLQSQLLSLLGKDKPEEYQIIHAQGAKRTDPRTLAESKDPDTVILFNKRNGTYEHIATGGAKQEGTKPKDKSQAEEWAKMALDNRVPPDEVAKRMKEWGY